MALPEGHEIEAVRGGDVAGIAPELDAFWAANEGLADGQTPAPESVVCVLRDGGGTVAGVATIDAQPVPDLGGRSYWLYRAFVPGGADAQHAALVVAAREILDREFLDSDGSGPIGLCLLVTNPGMIERNPAAVWPETGLTFAGYTPQGAQMRVDYFQGARVSPSKLTPAETVAARVGEPGREERRLGDGFEIRLFEESGLGEQAIIDLWMDAGIMPLEVAHERVAQVLYVAVERSSGAPVGLCTAYLGHLDHMRMDLWHYRTFVAKSHRDSDLARHLLYAAMDRLESRFTSGEDTRGPGMIFALENDLLKKVRNEARWLTTDFLFIGETPRGAHVRVRYFDGAEAPPPPASTDYA